MIRLSHSQVNMFESCPLQWYYSYVLKLPNNSPMHYADAGNALHKPLDFYYTDKKPKLVDIKERFNQLWDNKYKLNNSPIKAKKDLYWAMVIEGLKLNLPLTSSELQIYFKDFICYIDGIDSVNKIIYDWKSSTRSKKNEEEYKQQMICYSWMIYRKFGWIPEKCIVYYLKYSGSKGILEYIPTIMDTKLYEGKIKKIREEMNIIIKNKIAEKKENQNECSYFCGYKGQCFGKSINFKLEILGNNIFIRNHKSPLLTKGLDQIFSYTVEGVEFVEKHSKWDGIVKFFNRYTYSVPVGFRDRLIKALNKYCQYINIPLNYTIENLNHFKYSGDPICSDLGGIKLRDYQFQAADKAISEEIGCLHLATRSGKTLIATEIIRRLNLKTLWVTHSKELLTQTKNVLEKRLGINVGIIQGQNIDIQQITIGMVQTLYKRLDFYKEYLKHVDVLIVDEVHHFGSTSWQKVLKNCFAKYRIGLSGSIPNLPETMEIESQMGKIIYEVKSKDLIEQDYISRPKIIIKPVFNEMVRGDYKEVYEEFIVKNEKRNNMIADICNNSDGFNIVIVDRLDHGDILQKLIPKSVFINGTLKDSERKQIMQNASEGKINTLIGTVLKEGIDLENIENVVFARGGGKSEIPTIQGATRGLNKYKDKEKRIYDFYDKGKYIKSHSDMRIAIYKEYGDIEYDKGRREFHIC